MNAEERIEGVELSVHEMMTLRDCTQDWDFTDLKTEKLFLSWNNKQGEGPKLFSKTNRDIVNMNGWNFYKVSHL